MPFPSRMGISETTSILKISPIAQLGTQVTHSTKVLMKKFDSSLLEGLKIVSWFAVLATAPMIMRDGYHPR